MIAETRPLVEITVEALRLLYRELGLVDTVRFINQFTAGFGNYTEERRALIENQTFEEAMADIRAYQTRRASSESESAT
jgi:hypothetical protein